MLRILLIKKDESTKTHNFKVLNIIGKNDKNCEINFFFKCLFQFNMPMQLLVYFQNNEKQNKLFNL